MSQFLLCIKFLAQIENSLVRNNVALLLLLFFLFPLILFLSLLDGKKLDI